MKFTHSFPADGEYRFGFFDLDIGSVQPPDAEPWTTLVLMIDGKTVFKGPLGGEHDLRLANVKGCRRLAANPEPLPEDSDQTQGRSA